jgi:hypothetical protein
MCNIKSNELDIAKKLKGRFAICYPFFYEFLGISFASVYKLAGYSSFCVALTFSTDMGCRKYVLFLKAKLPGVYNRILL